MELDDHLFRREAGRMVAALTRIFGVHNLALAEDVVQDAFCRALEVWKFRGVPQNPSAWLMATAKNRAIDVLRRERTARTFAPELGRWLESEWTLVPLVEEQFGTNAVRDDLLRMMFSCCHPRLPEEAQVALVLHILCGFSVSEVAAAFLSTGAATQKRISRAKKFLAGSRRLFDLAGADFSARLSAVQRTLYLLFNEGYHGASAESAVRVELCREAMRLAGMLVEEPLTSTPATHALAALMSFNAARLPARVDESGNLSSLFDQDRSRWDRALIAEGRRLLDLSATGPALTAYHVEAAIASVHLDARSTEDTNWEQIVALYDTLMTIGPSPVVALNRAIAVAQHAGPERGLEAIRAIAGRDRLAGYPFYFAALGELELRCDRQDIAREHFQAAVALARNPMERRFLEQRASAAASKRVFTPEGPRQSL
ncbi:MAG TPA: sigma-70 family RNA polymerase sigma factor [Vicinamibacterales bacterium]|nr:sigma-70 family RNA polymerase sigma factor [Vicinamibacterales bacterium]